MSRPSYFDRSRNLQINGDINFIFNGGLAEDDTSFFHISQRVQASNAQSRAIDQGFKILCDNAAPSARYGYGHSFKGPQCHPGTRVAVQDHIFKWFDDENGENAMWMHGPVGIGKSAIAQTVAHLAAEREQLSSAFFFFRSDNARNSAKHLVATLAYEMTQQMPHTRAHVCETVASNPLIFSSPLEHQIQLTLLRPAESTRESSPRRRLVIIDGLDECLDIHTQQAIIRSFILTPLSMAADTIPHKILIVSRPESHISSAFSATDISPHVKRLPLDSWSMKDDIRSFLRAKLDEIRQTHPLRHHLPDNWPNHFSFDILLERSVGSFAYASVAVCHLSSHNNNPEHALRDLLPLQSTQVAVAFADLDALYRHILFSLDPKLRFVLQKVLCLHVYTRGSNSAIGSFSVALSEDHSIIELALVRVSSLIKIIDYNKTIKIHHSSFEEFLSDKTRSRDLYIYSPEVISTVAAALSNLWVHPKSDPSAYLWFGNLVQYNVAGMDMAHQVLNTLAKTKLPSSFLYPSVVLVESLPQMSDKYALCFASVLKFCFSLHGTLYRKPGDPDIWDSAYKALSAWLRSHLDIVFQGAPSAKDIIDVLLGNQWRWCQGVSYDFPSFRIFRHLVAEEDGSLLSSCICQVFPDMDYYTNICHAIIDRYIVLPAEQRRRDIEEWGWRPKEKNITLTKLYLMVLDGIHNPIPSVCHRLEQMVSAGQIALGPVITSQLTSMDYIFRFFDQGRWLRMDHGDDRKVSEMIQEYPHKEMVSFADCYKVARRTDSYILRAHAEQDFAYISADVEVVFKNQNK